MGLGASRPIDRLKDFEEFKMLALCDNNTNAGNVDKIV